MTKSRNPSNVFRKRFATYLAAGVAVSTVTGEEASADVIFVPAGVVIEDSTFDDGLASVRVCIRR